jgi:DnaJ-class molecular chaperone
MQGRELFCSVDVPLTTARLGGKVEVPTFSGKAVLKVKEGAQNGQRMRLRGKGLAAAKGSAAGDQIVELKVVLPKTLTPKARELVKKLEKELS